MREIFRGWKRKLGLVTLVMACVFAAGWVRSASTFDFICIPGRGTNYVLLSGDQKWLFVENKSVRTLTASEAKEVTIHISPNGSQSRYVWDTATANKIIVEWEHADGRQQLVEMYPYAVIVLPLTALSAWLLLSKPRQKPAMVPE